MFAINAFSKTPKSSARMKWSDGPKEDFCCNILMVFDSIFYDISKSPSGDLGVSTELRFTSRMKKPFNNLTM